MGSELIKYRSVLEANRETFLLNHKEEFVAFEHIDRCLLEFFKVVGTKKTDQGESIISLASFLPIIIRQGRNAFECLSRYQSSEAWLIFRPALEASLIIGKLLDDPANSSLWMNKRQIWLNRKDNRAEYEKYVKEFEKDGLIPKSLPMGDAFRRLLSKINDDFVHMNHEYFMRDIDVEDDGSSDILINIHFIDHNPYYQKAQLFSFLHMYYVLVSSLGKAFHSKYSQEKVLIVELLPMETVWKPKVDQLIKESQDLKDFFITFGLWNL